MSHFIREFNNRMARNEQRKSSVFTMALDAKIRGNAQLLKQHTRKLIVIDNIIDMEIETHPVPYFLSVFDFGKPNHIEKMIDYLQEYDLIHMLNGQLQENYDRLSGLYQTYLYHDQ